MLPPRFFALSPGELQAGDIDGFARQAAAAFDAGLCGLMLREPALGERDFLRLAHALAALARSHRAWFCVHDRVHMGVAVEADAVQLGFRSLPPCAARPLLRAGMALGLSTHAGDPAASWELCDYRIHGPVFDTPSKRGWKSPIGVHELGLAALASGVPVWAIGGLEPQHATLLRLPALGGVCARSSVFQAGDSAQACARRVAAWLGALPADSSPVQAKLP